jgi:hypothetical protein
LVAARVPVVGKGENEPAGGSVPKRRFRQRDKSLRLVPFSVAPRVDAILTDHQRSACRQMLKPVEIVSEDLSLVQVDVEAAKVLMRRLEKLRRGVIGIRRQTFRRSLMHAIEHLIEKRFDPSCPVEPDDVIWNFVRDANREYCRTVTQRSPDFGGSPPGRL